MHSSGQWKPPVHPSIASIHVKPVVSEQVGLYCSEETRHKPLQHRMPWGDPRCSAVLREVLNPTIRPTVVGEPSGKVWGTDDVFAKSICTFEYLGLRGLVLRHVNLSVRHLNSNHGGRHMTVCCAPVEF